MLDAIYTLRHLLDVVIRWLTPIVLLYALATVLYWGLALIAPRVAAASLAEGETLAVLAERVRAGHDLPALGVAIVSSAGLSEQAVVGVRRRGEPTAALPDDRWHLGSCGKAITATLVARLIERGVMRWDETVGERFGDLPGMAESPLARATITDLLAHRGGVPVNFDVRAYAGRRDVQAARRELVGIAARHARLREPGHRIEYSNWGYTIVGAMTETATGKPWEQLVEEEVFRPLGITSAGFGGTGTPGQVDQPWPHDARGRAAPSNGPHMDNPPAMGPAGRIHMTLADWARFVGEHLKGARGTSSYLARAGWQRLHSPLAEDYALGWLTPERAWAGGRTLHHAGDNTLNFALVWAAPARDWAVLVVTNQSGAAAAANDLASALIRARLGVAR